MQRDFEAEVTLGDSPVENVRDKPFVKMSGL